MHANAQKTIETTLGFREGGAQKAVYFKVVHLLRVYGQNGQNCGVWVK